MHGSAPIVIQLLGGSVLLLLVHIALQGGFAIPERGARWNAGPRDDWRPPRGRWAGRAQRRPGELPGDLPGVHRPRAGAGRRRQGRWRRRVRRLDLVDRPDRLSAAVPARGALAALARVRRIPRRSRHDADRADLKTRHPSIRQPARSSRLAPYGIHTSRILHP